LKPKPTLPVRLEEGYGQLQQFVETLRSQIRREYSQEATEPEKGFHFHTGRPLATKLGYREEWLAGMPEASVASLAGTGNPFSLGVLQPGEHVVDVGCGAGLDSLIAARMVGPSGRVIGVDMTPEMLAKARMCDGSYVFVPTRYHVSISPLPFTITRPRRSQSNSSLISSYVSRVI